MTEPLARRGLSTEAVDLPSCEAAFGELKDMYADVAAVSAAVAAAGEPIILCGHSYGGAVITDAGAGQSNVQHLIYITSVLPELGQSHADAVGAGSAPWAQPQPDGIVVLRSDRLRELFFADCDDPTFTEALTRAAPQAQSAFGQPVRRVAWREVPSTYVVCAEDRAVPAAGQRVHAAKATRTIELACGHHPFLSQPEALAQIIADSAGSPR
jgi:pimeloyl-ACP methyl ester carboxylesterase